MKTLFNVYNFKCIQILRMCYTHFRTYVFTLQYTFKICMLVSLSVVTVPFNNIKCVAKGTHATSWSPLVYTVSM